MRSDDFFAENEQSFFGDSTITSMTEEQTVDINNNDNDDDDDDDSFEVLSFEAPPENTLYIKGYFLIESFHLCHLFFFNRIRTYNSK